MCCYQLPGLRDHNPVYQPRIASARRDQPDLRQVATLIKATRSGTLIGTQSLKYFLNRGLSAKIGVKITSNFFISYFPPVDLNFG